jgi:hydroxymethylpyrimidine pyrophosphatase-like HAD family hydrolase
MKPLILAIDFDGTLIKNEKDYVPRAFLPEAKEVVNWAHEKGCFIIIWTCRSGKMLQPAIDFLKNNDVKFDKVNENYPQVGFETSNKIYADFYIDDRSFDIDWKEIKKMIAKKAIQKMADEIEELTKEMQLKQAAADPQVKRTLEFLWKEYEAGKIDDKELSRRMGETLKKFGMNFFFDKHWLNKFLKMLTGHEWQLTPKDFAQA